MISVILPIYNEEDYIRNNTLKIMHELGKISRDYEIIIIEESSDKTPEIAAELGKKYRRIRHFHFEKRLGKGRAIEYGIARAKGQKIIFMDIDLSVDISSLAVMLSELDKYDVVVGSRYHPNSKSRRTFLRLLLGRTYGFLPRLVLGVNIRDFQCGFKGFRKDAATMVTKFTKSPGVFWDTEALFLSRWLGFTIKEIPVSWVEKKTRNTKISIKTIYSFAFSVVKLFLQKLLNRDRIR